MSEQDKLAKTLQRSTRHSKIAGNFGEQLTLYWLSKHGIECALVDHTGIDIIARIKTAKQPFGISVKCRTRSEGKEKTPTGIKTAEVEKIIAACENFNCEPYLSFVVDAKSSIYLFILALDHFKNTIGREGKIWFNFPMTKTAIEEYMNDPKIMSARLDYFEYHW